jgi:hypothetical protein
MTRFVTYDPEVAARLAQAVGVHRVELRDARQHPNTTNPALFDAVRSPQRSAVLMPSSDEQILLVRMNEGSETKQKKRKKTAKKSADPEIHEVGSQPSGFLGLHDEPVFSQDDEEEPPRSLWKNDDNA